MENNFYAVILAGGGGTRLWPKSRKKHPKHLLKLFGDKTLFRHTYERIAPVIPNERILVITHVDHAQEIVDELPELSKDNFIIEPEAKNTALAMGVAAAFVHKRNLDSVIINLAADHIYLDVPKFQQTALTALNEAAKGDYIVTIGIKPTFAHTGLGYIKMGEKFGEHAYIGEGFKEKPNLETAQAFLAEGNYVWNANLYCWSTKTVLEAFKKHSPQISKCMEEIMEASGTPDEKQTMEKVYMEAPSEQIDTAISEKADNLLIVEGDFGWSDIGDWKVVYDTNFKDENNNVIIKNDGDLIEMGNSNSLIETNGRLVVAIGLENIVVVDTEDAILIVSKDKTQDVKKAVEKLKEMKKGEYL